jgi:hypothetical protein
VPAGCQVGGSGIAEGSARSVSTRASGSASPGLAAAVRRPPPARSAAPAGRRRSPAVGSGAGSRRSSPTDSADRQVGRDASSTGTSRRRPLPRPSAGRCPRPRHRSPTQPAGSTARAAAGPAGTPGPFRGAGAASRPDDRGGCDPPRLPGARAHRLPAGPSGPGRAPARRQRRQRRRPGRRLRSVRAGRPRGFLAVYPQGIAVGAGRPFWAAAGRVEAGVDDLRFITDLLGDLQAASASTRPGWASPASPPAAASPHWWPATWPVGWLPSPSSRAPCTPSRASAAPNHRRPADRQRALELRCRPPDPGLACADARRPAARGMAAGQVTSWRAPLRTS